MSQNKTVKPQIKTEATIYYADGRVEQTSTNKKKFILELLQSFVEECIQVSKLDKTQDYILNEEGRLLSLQQNPFFPQFVGNVIVINRKFY